MLVESLCCVKVYGGNINLEMLHLYELVCLYKFLCIVFEW